MKIFKKIVELFAALLMFFLLLITYFVTADKLIALNPILFIFLILYFLVKVFQFGYIYNRKECK